MSNDLPGIIASAYRPPAGPVRTAIGTWGTTNNVVPGSTPIVTSGFNVQAGDLIVCAFGGNGDDPTFLAHISDAAANTWSIDFDGHVSGPTGPIGMYFAHAIASANYTGNTISFVQNYYFTTGILYAFVYRAPAGKTWSVDTGNIVTGSGTYGTASQSMNANISGGGAICVLRIEMSGLSNVSASCTGATIQAGGVDRSATHQYISFLADLLTASALSSVAITTAIGSNTGSNIPHMTVVPYKYS